MTITDSLIKIKASKLYPNQNKHYSNMASVAIKLKGDSRLWILFTVKKIHTIQTWIDKYGTQSRFFINVPK